MVVGGKQNAKKNKLLIDSGNDSVLFHYYAGFCKRKHGAEL